MTQKSTPDTVPSAASAPANRPRCVILAPPLLPTHETGQISGWVIGRIVKPTLEALPFGFLVDVPSPSTKRITGQSISLIARAELIVADLTGQPPEVFYHLATAHALKKKTLHIAMKGQQIPFDHKECRVLFYDMGWIEDSAQATQAFQANLSTLLSATAPPPSPVAAAHTFHLLERGKDPRSEAVAILAQQVAELGEKLARLEQRSAAQEALPPVFSASVETAIRDWEEELEAMKRLRRSLENDRIANELEKVHRYDEALLHRFPSPLLRV